MFGPMPAVHPGEILREEFMNPRNLTGYAVAKACHVPRTRIERLARCEGVVTADTAMRLGRLFGTGPEFWMNLQTGYELAQAQTRADDINRIKPLVAA